MKKLLLIFAVVFWSSFTLAQEQTGNITLELDETEENKQEIKLSDVVDGIWEIGEYFHTNYPGDMIETDLKPDIEKFFPDLTPQELYDKESLIRRSIKIYRWGKQKYEEIKSSFLVPEEPILTYKDSEYENPKDYTYEDVGKDKVKIITDIKKVISYSADKKERETYAHYKDKKENFSKLKATFPEIAKLWKSAENIEWKKLPFYGIIYDDPRTNGEGISPWLKQELAQIQLGFERSRLEDNSEIKGVVSFKVSGNQMLLAQPYEKYPEVTVNFDQSQNIKSCDLFQPLPSRFYAEDGDLIIYRNNFAYPFLCQVEDTQKSALINGKITYSLCDKNKKCHTYHAEIKEEIHAGSGYKTMMNNFITQTFNLLPKREEQDMNIEDISVISDTSSPSGDVLRLVIESDNRIESPEIFIKTKDNIRFGHPKIAIDGKRIFARFDILTTEHNLSQKEVEITFAPNFLKSYRITKQPQSSSVFDINSKKLNIGLILLAFLGGVLLNFMPCVFPVLSLKILSLTKFGAKNEYSIRQSFTLSALGIFCGFFFLASSLTGLKILGQNLGWGMQFQNPVFLIVMIFAILLFIAQIQGIFSFQFSFNKSGKKKKSLPTWDAFLSGLLIVLMATPCTGPYLGTTIGFALSGTPTDIFAIMGAVALGLSFPYLLLACFPILSYAVPPPGAWMKKVHIIMQIMLLLTLIWLLSILKAQSSWLTVSSILMITVLFYFALYVYHQSLQGIEKDLINKKQTLKKAKKFIHVLHLSILGSLFVLSLIIGISGFSHHQEQTARQTTTNLDFNQIREDVAKGYNVIVRIGADWCLTCSYNNFLVFDNTTSQDIYKQYNVKFINIDWTEYNPAILDFMSEYGRRGLPFYILYNQNIPEGLVLPEILSQMEFENILFGNGVKITIPEETKEVAE